MYHNSIYDAVYSKYPTSTLRINVFDFSEFAFFNNFFIQLILIIFRRIMINLYEIEFCRHHYPKSNYICILIHILCSYFFLQSTYFQ